MMKDKNNEMTDRELLGLMDRWQVELPGQQFFASLPAVVQSEFSRPAIPWWRAALAPLPAMSFLLIALLSLGFYGLGSRQAADNSLARAAADWASEDFGWSSIDRALEALKGDPDASSGDRLEAYLSLLDRGTYQPGGSGSGQGAILDELSDDDLELLIEELQNTRS
jgi:hypothetical protein